MPAVRRVGSWDKGSRHYPVVHIKGMTSWLPDVAEQRAIAEVQSYADREINRLRTRLVKAQAVRQGMMQQLLTGGTRLPVQETAS